MNDEQSGNSAEPLQSGSSPELGNESMGNAEEQTASDGQTQFEGVTASQFDAAMQSVNDRLDALNVSSILLVAALFACFGAICVQTLLRSMTWDS